MKAHLRLYRFVPHIMLAAVLAIGTPAFAQSYPGLSGSSQNSNSNARQPNSGYGGLTRSAPVRKAPVRTRIGGEEENDQSAVQDSRPSEQETQQAIEQQNRQLQQQALQQSQNLSPQVETSADLETAALIERTAIVRPSAQPGPKISQKTLDLLNRPQQMKDGMWPDEARAVSYIKAAFVDIQNTPVHQRRDKIKTIKLQIENMIDANLNKQAIPDAVSLKMGLTQNAVDQKKAAAKATNVRLKQALSKLR